MEFFILLLALAYKCKNENAVKKLLIILFLLPVFLYSQKRINYDIYSYLINDDIEYCEPGIVKLLVVDDSIVIENVILEIKNHMDHFNMDDNDPIYDSLPDFPKPWEVQALLDVILTESQLDIKYKLEADSFKTRMPLVLHDEVSRANLRKSEDYWTEFNKLYPDSFGLFSFSPVFYSGRLAAAYIEHRLGSEFIDSGFVMIMQKKDNKWKLCLPVMLWINSDIG